MMFYIKIFSRHITTKCFKQETWQSFHKYCPPLYRNSTGFLYPSRNPIKSISSFGRQYAKFSSIKEFRNHRSVLGMKITVPNYRTYSQGLSPEGRKRLQWATYLSCLIGVGLMSAIGLREFKKFKKTARGMEPIEPELGITGRHVVKYRYRGYVIPVYTADVMDNVFRFQVREDDTWVVSFPKAGTTWLTEMVYLIMSDLNYDDARQKTIDERVPFFEFVMPGLRSISKQPSPRIIKTHLPFSLLPTQLKEKKPKIIYIARNPKDTVVSYYHFTKALAKINYNGDFNHFFNEFFNNTMLFGPWWKHVKEGWQMRDEDNVLFLTYEQMKKDLPGTIRMVSMFLGKPLNEAEIEKLAEHCSFKNMKANPCVNYSWYEGWIYKKEHEEFMRKGIIGDWKNFMTDEMAKQMDDLVARELKGTGLQFYDVSPETRV
ncbi:sulfotransferase family cytosolic 1B member 1-like [Gigantopelta aegis]|uniref:sulfotransferase family cytosolic 1B member 1-like n=1 Tax=Gigantopelta aegis TaxID=1735272 RepID=UPI001B88E26D|nr:sulfotransferase family cytosolic 1B member 1-like [Gigantopelta aegis]